MKKATFDPAANLDLYLRKGRNGSKVFTFTDVDGEDYELNDEFQFIADFDAELTKSTNKLTLSVTEEDTENVRNAYRYEIYNETLGKTWLVGTCHFTETTSAEVSDSEGIVIILNGEVVNITIQGYGDIDGGTP